MGNGAGTREKEREKEREREREREIEREREEHGGAMGSRAGPVVRGCGVGRLIDRRRCRRRGALVCSPLAAPALHQGRQAPIDVGGGGMAHHVVVRAVPAGLFVVHGEPAAGAAGVGDRKRRRDREPGFPAVRHFR